MKGLDFKKFKKVHDDDHKAVLQHADGHEIHIAKKALSKDMRKQLEGLEAPQKMADGGQVKPIEKSFKEQLKSKPKVEQEADKTKSAQDSMRKAFGFADGGEVPEEEPKLNSTIIDTPELRKALEGIGRPAEEPVVDMEAMARQDPNAAMAMQQQAQAPVQVAAPMAEPAQTRQVQGPTAQPDVLGYGQMAETMGQGVQSTLAGYEKQAQAEAQQGRAEAEAASKSAHAIQEMQGHFQQSMDELNKERSSFIQDYQNKHIDPQHYMSSMTDGQRTSTAIGLIAAGFAGAGQHAVDYLNKQIDRDIDAQKAELGKKENLLSANLRQFGNLKDATAMTHVMQNDLLATQMKEAAAKAMDPMAKARLLQQSGDFLMKNAPILQQMAMRKAMVAGVNSGSVSPEKMIGVMVPQHLQKDAYKEMAEAQQMTKFKDNALHAFDELDKLSLAGSLTPGKRAALLNPIVAELSKATAGRFTETDAGMIQALFPAGLDAPSTRQVRRQQLLQTVIGRMNFPVLQGNFIPLPQGIYDKQGQRLKLGKPVR